MENGHRKLAVTYGLPDGSTRVLSAPVRSHIKVILRIERVKRLRGWFAWAKCAPGLCYPSEVEGGLDIAKGVAKHDPSKRAGRFC
jgi:hypothetical protein